MGHLVCYRIMKCPFIRIVAGNRMAGKPEDLVWKEETASTLLAELYNDPGKKEGLMKLLESSTNLETQVIAKEMASLAGRVAKLEEQVRHGEEFKSFCLCMTITDGDFLQMEMAMARMEEMNITIKMLMGVKQVLDAGGSNAVRLARVRVLNSHLAMFSSVCTFCCPEF